jgi:hypothetical protein
MIGWVFQGRSGSTDWSWIIVKVSHIGIKNGTQRAPFGYPKFFPCLFLSCKKLPACNTQTTGHSPLSPRTWRLHLRCLTFTASLTLNLNTPGLNPRKPSRQSYPPPHSHKGFLHTEQWPLVCLRRGPQPRWEIVSVSAIPSYNLSVCSEPSDAVKCRNG